MLFHHETTGFYDTRWLIFSFVLILPCPSLLFGQNARDEIRQQVPSALKILKSWEDEDPQHAVRQTHVVYWTPADREPAVNYESRLSSILENIRDFYEAQMQLLGFGDRTFNLVYDEQDQLVIHQVHGSEPAKSYSVKSGQQIRNDCIPVLKNAGINANQETILIFCNLSDWNAKTKTIKQDSPYYAGGSSRNGTAWQVDSPILNLDNLREKQPIVRDGQYGRISLGKYNSIFIGGIAHEFGHALGLPHNREREDQRIAFGTALMGSGNRTYGNQLRGEGSGSFLTLAHAMRLASHPQFSGSVKQIQQNPTVEFDEFGFEVTQTGFQLTGSVRGSPPVYGIVAYLDPLGGSDYDAVTATAVPNDRHQFKLDCRDLAPDKAAELRIVALHVNGTTSRFTKFPLPFKTDRQGVAELSTIQNRIALEQLITALNSRDEELIRITAARTADNANESKNMELLKLVKSLSSQQVPTIEPYAVGDEVRSISLSQTKPSSAKDGWQRPSYNRTPQSPWVLSASGQLFAEGIYAHAPANHKYRTGGTWQTISGNCAVSDTHPNATITFEIKVDGESVWKSGAASHGKLYPFEIEIDGCDDVELIVDDGGNGKASDWGLWLDVQLHRN